MGFLGILLLIGYYSYRYYQKKQATQPATEKPSTSPEASLKTSEMKYAIDDTPSSAVQPKPVTDVPTTNIEDIIRNTINKTDYLDGTMRFHDLVVLIKMELQLKGISIEKNDLTNKIDAVVTVVIFEKLKPIINQDFLEDSAEFLLLFSLLPNNIIYDFLENYSPNDLKATISPTVYIKTEYFLIRALGVNTLGNLLTSDDTAYMPNLKKDEVLYWFGSIQLYEHKVTNTSINYDGFSGHFAGMDAGSYNYENNRYSDIVQTIEGSLYLTSDRLIIEGYDLYNDHDASKTISLSSILDYYPERDYLSINLTNSNIGLGAGAIPESQNDRIFFKTLEYVLNQILHPSEDYPTVQENFTFEEGHLYYLPTNQNKMSELAPKINKIFDGHVHRMMNSALNNDSDNLEFQTETESDTRYFRNLIINDPEQWLLKVTTLFKTQFKYLHCFLVDYYPRMGIRIEEHNYPDKVYTLFGWELHDYVLNLSVSNTDTYKYSEYKQENTVIPRPLDFNRLTDDLRPSALELLNHLYFYSEALDDALAVTLRENENYETFVQEMFASNENINQILDDILAMKSNLQENKQLIFFPIPTSSFLDLATTINNYTEQDIALEKICLAMFDSENNLIGGMVKNLTEQSDDDNEMDTEDNLATDTSQSTNFKQPSDSNDKFSEIKKYKELLDNDIITQEEFNLKKKELLDL